MAALEPLEEGMLAHPSAPAISETSGASSTPGSQTPLHTTTAEALQALLNPKGQQSSSGAESLPLRPDLASEAEDGSTTGLATASAIRRKPVAPVPARPGPEYSPRDPLGINVPLTAPEHRFSRSPSAESPTLYYFADGDQSAGSSAYSPVSRRSEDSSAQQVPASDRQAAPETQPAALEGRNISSQDPAVSQTVPLSKQHANLTADVNERPELEPAGQRTQEQSEQSEQSGDDPSAPVITPFVRKAAPPNLNLDDIDPTTKLSARQALNTTNEVSGLLNKPLPKSPTPSKLGSFFGWNNSPSPSSLGPSDKDFSPIPSPFPSTRAGSGSTDDSSATSKDAHAGFANALDRSPLDYCEAYLQTPPAPDSTQSTFVSNTHVPIEEMEDELKAISAELASSIRREMDLEDLVDRLQAEASNSQAPGKRTSDYFSDSGYSSAKFSDYDASKEEIAQVQRRAEQEQAKIRLELTDKLQDERSKRLLLDRQIKELATRASQVEIAQSQSKDVGGRVKTLETTCEDLRRKLSEERQVKGNFEELLTALKGELQNAANERDNLRDEIVPQLRARVEGLEAQATEYAKMTYDSTKLQQEMQSLKVENTNLRSSSGGPASKVPSPLSLPSSNPPGLGESREALSERLKDVEAQRDALHNALKNLLDRQEYQQRENEKKIKSLEIERERLLSTSPGKSSYEKEVTTLRQEITMLRRRADDAFEHKWQVEKGLTSLKMDLDRAEQEIVDLKALLKTNDVLSPSAAFSRSSGSSNKLATPVSSASLEKSYRDLQAAYAEALERIKSLETNVGGIKDEKTELALKRLEQSLATAVSERDAARREAESYKSKVDSMQSSEKAHMKSERDLADQLHNSARRVEELAQQVRNQLEANAALRERLSQTVARGEAEQKANEDRILGMQSRLKSLEEQLVAAQSAAEERVTRHEGEISALKDAHSVQLQRLRDASGGLRSPRLMPPTGTSPLASPRLAPSRPSSRRSNTAPLDNKAAEAEAAAAAQVEALRARVTELEGALASADSEMQEVVGRMNSAQIEVMSLQEERETAIRETRRLQRTIEEEKVKAFEERFKTITTAGR